MAEKDFILTLEHLIVRRFEFFITILVLCSISTLVFHEPSFHCRICEADRDGPAGGVLDYFTTLDARTCTQCELLRIKRIGSMLSSLSGYIDEAALQHERIVIPLDVGEGSLGIVKDTNTGKNIVRYELPIARTRVPELDGNPLQLSFEGESTFCGVLKGPSTGPATFICKFDLNRELDGEHRIWVRTGGVGDLPAGRSSLKVSYISGMNVRSSIGASSSRDDIVVELSLDD
ncbi:MAG: hypothetical protein QF415_07950 [Candidatus Undinarchaeales archaeon]|jgi:hypothetical protein|nr:hypothetical protein [Candidatus Undinarchaeales archaeon]MDP7492970.1 hypothetical protein [Candidatus Undinarchaeales archaeon]